MQFESSIRAIGLQSSNAATLLRRLTGCYGATVITNHLIRIILMLAPVILPTSAVQAKTLTTCEFPSGYSFYLDDTKWVKGGITGGKIAIAEDNGTYDVLFIDARGKTSSSQDLGGVVLIENSKTALTLLAIDAGKSAELITYHYNGNKILWTKHAFAGSILDKVVSMVASNCE